MTTPILISPEIFVYERQFRRGPLCKGATYDRWRIGSYIGRDYIFSPERFTIVDISSEAWAISQFEGKEIPEMMCLNGMMNYRARYFTTPEQTKEMFTFEKYHLKDPEIAEKILENYYQYYK